MISVAIPAYNAADYLAECLDSVLAQTLQPAEIIVVDDGSTDSTAELLEHRYPQVRCIRQKNAGISAARNAGIEAAQYDLIAFGDADDIWHPRRMELQHHVMMQDPPADVVACPLLRFHDAATLEWPQTVSAEYEEIDFRWLFMRGGKGFPNATWLARRKVFQQAGLLDVRQVAYEEMDIALRVAAAGCVGRKTRIPLYAYRQVPSSKSTKDRLRPVWHYRAMAKHRPQSEAADVPLGVGEYWRYMSASVVTDMLASIVHGHWDDAREIGSEMSHAPPGGPWPVRRARILAQAVRSISNPLAERVLTRLLASVADLSGPLRRLGSRW